MSTPPDAEPTECKVILCEGGIFECARHELLERIARLEEIEKNRIDGLASLRKRCVNVPCYTPDNLLGEWEDGSVHCWECEYNHLDSKLASATTEVASLKELVRRKDNALREIRFQMEQNFYSSKEKESLEFQEKQEHRVLAFTVAHDVCIANNYIKPILDEALSATPLSLRAEVEARENLLAVVKDCYDGAADFDNLNPAYEAYRRACGKKE